jgi:hypothetical protein
MMNPLVCMEVFNCKAPRDGAAPLLDSARERLDYLDWNSMTKHGDEVLLAYDSVGNALGGIEFITDETRIGFTNMLHLNRVHVADDCLNQKISKRLLNHFFAEVKNRGVAHLGVCYFSGAGENYLRKAVEGLAKEHARHFMTHTDMSPI